MSNKDFDEFLKHSLQDMPAQIQPTKDLWQGIERAIDFDKDSKKTHAMTKLSMIAACFAVALFGLTFLQLAPNTMVTKDNTLLTMSDSFSNQKQALLVQYQKKPALTDDWQMQLADLEQAEQAIKQALVHEPENSSLLRMLAQIYRQQLELINRVHQPQYEQI